MIYYKCNVSEVKFFEVYKQKLVYLTNGNNKILIVIK
jgi:hypothetical protein